MFVIHAPRLSVNVVEDSDSDAVHPVLVLTLLKILTCLFAKFNRRALYLYGNKQPLVEQLVAHHKIRLKTIKDGHQECGDHFGKTTRYDIKKGQYKDWLYCIAVGT